MRFEYLNISTEQEDHEDICNLLNKIAETGRSVSCVNYYMEMPIVSKSKIVASDQGAFVVYPAENQLKVMSEKLKTIINVDSDKCILANCQAISMKTNEAVLSGFRYISLHCENRDACRVRLIKPINVTLETENGKMAGVLKDISLSGCRVATFMRTLQPGANVKLMLKMFDAATSSVVDIAANAVLMRMESDKMPIACGFRFELDSITEEKLVHFINQRQMELIKSLKDSLT
jgi:DNA-directed RNA polymerase subunit L